MFNFFKKKTTQTVEETTEMNKFYAVKKSINGFEIFTVGAYLGNNSDGSLVLRLPYFDNEVASYTMDAVEGPYASSEDVFELLKQARTTETVTEQAEPESTTESEYYAQRIARRIVAENHEGFEWVGELTDSQISNLSTHVCNYAAKAEKKGETVRTLQGKRDYRYNIEFFKGACLQWREFAIAKLGYVPSTNN